MGFTLTNKWRDWSKRGWWRWSFYDSFRTEIRYDLQRHLYICGLSGTGKTNTTMKVLQEAKVPFLVVEPKSSQYYKLSVDNKKTHRFVIGSDNEVGIELNPFYIPYGGDFTMHVEMLKRCFADAIDSQEPLVYIYLEKAIPEIYYDRGWDRVTCCNPRLRSREDYEMEEHFFYFPRMIDLYEKICELAENSKFQEGGENKGTIREFADSFIGQFLKGSLGLVFNTYRNDLFQFCGVENMVLEIRTPSSEQQKCIMNVLLASISQMMTTMGESKSLRQLVVFEEAHLLFPPDKSDSKKQNSSGEKLMELITTARKYGVGLIITNQHPAEIHESVIRNIEQRFIHSITSDPICEIMADDYNISKKDISDCPLFTFFYRNRRDGSKEKEFKARRYRAEKVERSKPDDDGNARDKWARRSKLLGYANSSPLVMSDQLEYTRQKLTELMNNGHNNKIIKEFGTKITQMVNNTHTTTDDTVLPEYLTYLTCSVVAKYGGRLKKGDYTQTKNYYTLALEDKDDVEISVPRIFSEFGEIKVF